MKKILAITILALAVIGLTCGICSAQSNIPRFGTKPSDSNTGASLNYKTFSIALANTDSVRPDAYHSQYAIDTLKAAKTITIKTTSAKKWDRVTLRFICDTLTAGRVVTFRTSTGGNPILWTSTSGNTMTVKKSKRAVITFVFDGVLWCEEHRSIQF